MSDRVTNIGEQYNVSGHGTGKVVNYGSTDSATTFRELTDLVQALRREVPAADRQALDESLVTIRKGEQAEPGALRRALGTVASVATLVGDVGVPVITAVRKVLALLAI